MIGTVIGNFRIVAQLGKGGMGEVWLAEQQSIKTKVAIKLLRDDVSADVTHVQRFFNEAVAVSKIRHAGIVRIFDVGFLGARAYLVMELLEGETVTRRIGRAGRLPLREVCDVGRQVAGVLDATHAAGIIHRDLKPDNVFLVLDAELPSGERAKVLDFGIAKLGSVGMTSTSVSSMGTPLYMSPEQWRSVAKVDGRTDAYSLGCVVFEMACGRPPFLAESMGEACAKHLTEEPPAASSVVPALPPAFDQLVARLLDKDPAGRPSMKEVMAAFDAIAQGAPPAVYGAYGGAASPPLPTAPVAAGAATVSTVGAIPLATAATAGTGPVMAPAGAPASPGTGPVTAPAGPPASPGTGPVMAPPPVTTLGGSAGSTHATGAHRGGTGRVVRRIAAAAVVAAAAATAAVLVVRAKQPPGDGAGSQVVAPVPAPPPPAPPPPPPQQPQQPQQPQPPQQPPSRPNLPLVSASVVKKLSGAVPKKLPTSVSAQLCINEAGAVTFVDVPLDIDPVLSERVRQQLETWRYEPFRRGGKPMAVCFSQALSPEPADPPPPGGGSGKPAPPPGGGSGSGKPAPPPGDGSGSGSGKPAPPPGGGSGSGKPAPQPGSGSGSGKPAPPPGGGSGKPPPPPPPGTPDQLTHAELAAVMPNIEADVRECRKRGASGRVRVLFRVAPNGSVSHPRIQETPGPGPSTCVRRALKSATFPETKRGGGPFTHDFH